VEAADLAVESVSREHIDLVALCSSHPTGLCILDERERLVLVKRAENVIVGGLTETPLSNRLIGYGNCPGTTTPIGPSRLSGGARARTDVSWSRNCRVASQRSWATSSSFAVIMESCLIALLRAFRQ